MDKNLTMFEIQAVEGAIKDLREMREELAKCVNIMRDIFIESAKDKEKIALFLQVIDFHHKILGEMAVVLEPDPPITPFAGENYIS